MEPRRDLDRLFGLAARGRGELAAGRHVGRSSRAPPPAAARREPARYRSGGQRIHFSTLANHPALWGRDDDRRQLPRAGRLCAAAFAPFRPAARHGDLDCAVGQRLRARRLGAARPITDLYPRLARDLSRASDLYDCCRTVPRLAVSPRCPLPDSGGTRTDARLVRLSSRCRLRSGAWREAIRTRHFWLLFAVYLFTGLGSFLVSLHQLAFAVDVGFDKLYAAGVLGLGSFLAIAGTIFTGTLSDYIGRESAAILAYGISILGVVCALLITGPDQGWLLWLHACFFGLTWGARGPAITAKTADLFPGRQLGTILGVITIGSGIGSAAGSWAAGWIFDLSGSYRLAFLLSIAAYLCGCVAFWALRRPPMR